MSLAEAFVLALIQGVTEFLPISSSAHLILVPYVLGWEDHDLRFDVVTNAGTLLAAVVYFRRELAEAWRGLRGHVPGGRTPDPHAPDSRTGPGLLPAVLAASIPALVVGFLFRGWFETIARRPELIASMSIGFGLLLWWADHWGSRSRELGQLTWRDSLWIGVAQAFALIPGTSRSGVTITAGLALGFTRREAAHFSFLLAIPIGIAAVAKDALDLLAHGLPRGELAPLVVGFVVSAVSAYLVIGWLLAWLRRQTMTLFVVYRVVLGFVILAWVFVSGGS